MRSLVPQHALLSMLRMQGNDWSLPELFLEFVFALSNAEGLFPGQRAGLLTACNTTQVLQAQCPFPEAQPTGCASIYLTLHVTPVGLGVLRATDINMLLLMLLAVL